ncbi:TetR/AcrR family transcriptional regulator (plasmid) [Streptomyces sp. NBC_01795]|uniref:TetR/AcrR family transcriptional regulator n=1 Tax=unclassified Streptomyces TaxID=2593676 RepID=UPI002DDB7142|nr:MULTISPECIES: TetR/AcrR family transcriptional regulator [unclassified Streptomyces]WSA97630.1 TetR/AcrR family transcriptional regulator [Streptomyces sp. NBC_01795]WSB82120.1 TetR/AcrR family transcriptional regulator [Streptomyces sp. NBC_01775]WSS18091.1 TetR/AcrR family transcriptional regulator [Streptomyces sp. NBC_01186]
MPLDDFPDLDDVLGGAEQSRGIRDADGAADRRFVEQLVEPGQEAVAAEADWGPVIRLHLTNGTQLVTRSSPPPADAPRTAGRRKDPQIDSAALQATLELLAEIGYAEMSFSKVAERVGVHRPAIYRRWPSKQHLVAEAVGSALGHDPTPDTGDLRADLITGISTLVDSFEGTVVGNVLPALVADLAHHARLREDFLASVFQARRDSTARRLRRAAAQGEIRSDFDLEFTMDALAAPVYYRALFGHAPVTRKLAEQSVDLVLASLATR